MNYHDLKAKKPLPQGTIRQLPSQRLRSFANPHSSYKQYLHKKDISAAKIELKRRGLSISTKTRKRETGLGLFR